MDTGHCHDQIAQTFKQILQDIVQLAIAKNFIVGGPATGQGQAAKRVDAAHGQTQQPAAGPKPKLARVPRNLFQCEPF
jgi:hypothetical protein